MKTKGSMRETEKVSVLRMTADGKHVGKCGEAMVNKAFFEKLKKGECQQLLYKGKFINAHLSAVEWDGSKTYYAILDKDVQA